MKTIQAGLLLLSLAGTLNASAVGGRWLQEDDTAIANQDNGDFSTQDLGDNQAAPADALPEDSTAAPADEAQADGAAADADAANGEDLADAEGEQAAEDDSDLLGAAEEVDNSSCPNFESILSAQGTTADDLADFPCQLFFKKGDLGLVGNFSQAIQAMTEQLALSDVGIVDFAAPIVANMTEEAASSADEALSEDNQSSEEQSSQDASAAPLADAAASQASQFAQYTANAQYSADYRFYLLENQSVLMRKYMKEVLEQHANLMNYVEGIYKNQQMILYWINDQESRLSNLTSGAVANATDAAAELPADDSAAQDLPIDDSAAPAEGEDAQSQDAQDTQDSQAAADETNGDASAQDSEDNQAANN